MIVRALDFNNDWTFGSGKNNYKSKIMATSQNIQTRLSSFVGDCFFATDAGIDWFNLLGSKQELALKLAISSVIINTQDVTGLKQLFLLLNDQRRFTISYSVQTTFGVVDNTFQYDLS